MRIDYRTAIVESEADLAEREQALRGQRTAVRAMLLRLLKSGRVRSLRAAAPLVGYSERQLQTWWAHYRAGGLAAVLSEAPRPVKRSRLTAEAYAGLEAEMRAGRVATLKDAQAYLERAWGISYRTVNGVWVQLRKRGAKLKTGRRRHRRADAEQQAAYKRDVRTAARGPTGQRGLGV